MITVKKISKSELAEYVDISYKGDKELLEKYHIKKFENVQPAVFTTMLMIHEMSESEDLSYYKVMYNKQPIGYIVTFHEFLYSFGVNKKFRTKEILIEFWNTIKGLLGKKFVSMLYDNNTRAISWLVKCGMKIFKHDLENHSVILIKS